MPNAISMLYSAAGTTIGGGVKAVRSGLIGKTILGAAIGTGIGVYSGYSAADAITSGLRGAALGAIGGASIWGATKGVKFGLHNARPIANSIWKSRIPQKTITSGTRLGMFVLDNPALTLGAVGGGLLAITATNKAIKTTNSMQTLESPTLEGDIGLSTNYDKQAILNTSIGSGTFGGAEMIQQFDYANWMSSVGKTMVQHTKTARLADSTVGLPFGMHAGRHG